MFYREAISFRNKTSHLDWKHWDKAGRQEAEFSNVTKWQSDLPLLVTMVQHQRPNSALGTNHRKGGYSVVDVDTAVPRPTFHLNLAWFIWDLCKNNKELLEQKVTEVQEGPEPVPKLSHFPAPSSSAMQLVLLVEMESWVWNSLHLEMQVKFIWPSKSANKCQLYLYECNWRL